MTTTKTGSIWNARLAAAALVVALAALAWLAYRSVSMDRSETASAPSRPETRETPGASASGQLTPVQLALGKRVYDANCAQCHGANLEGQPNWRERLPNGRMPAPPHDETGHTWHHPDAVLFGIVKFGLGPYAPAGYQSDMPAFGDRLSDDEIRAVLAYIESRWSPKIQQWRAQLKPSPVQERP